MNEQNKIETTWWERNKKRFSSSAELQLPLVQGVLVFKNKDALIELVKGGKKLASKVPPIADTTIIETTTEVITTVETEAITVSKTLNNGNPFGVEGFIRNLPDGWHPSAEKIAQAAALGIKLGEHQTLVDPYMKNVA